jgi:23S rRNA (adenine2030-N6)-methyltransferase
LHLDSERRVAGHGCSNALVRVRVYNCTRPSTTVKYRHAHHAGNFADAVKHLVLIELLDALKRKPAPFLYLETHAGRGEYPLPPPEVRPGSEFDLGFGRLLRAGTAQPASLVRYMDTVRQLSEGARSPIYPGSPLIAASLLRPGDRAVFHERQGDEAAALRKLFNGRKGVSVHHGDGYAGLRSHLPPAERRGLVFIDPAYEEQEREFDTIRDALRDSLQRWATGVYAIWYPIKRLAPVRRFHEEVVSLGARRVLVAELCIYPPDSRAVSLNGCGVLVINTPWQVDEKLALALPALHRALDAKAGTSAGSRWLAGD